MCITCNIFIYCYLYFTFFLGLYLYYSYVVYCVVQCIFETCFVSNCCLTGFLDLQNKYVCMCVKCHKVNDITVELFYIDLGLCDTLFIMLYVLWQQLIPHKAHVFLLCLLWHAMTLPVISSNIIFQEVGYFEKSAISLSLRALYSFRQLYKFQTWKMKQ